MWLERDAQIGGPDWFSANQGVQIAANYRRGVLRAKVNVQRLTCQTAMLDCMDRPQPGTLIWLTLSGLEARSAMVESCEGFRMTIRFVEPFHPAVRDAILGGTIRAYH
ncbi:hypothetical protein OVA07_11745 [Novosphingobium sp. SL115]|uniref:hypothetical protein n=1 Tax=Novosphingobium sp. SL115 TaxID=2995150 RepID=UPI002274D6D1|nr:hypothetical protein [Novosphingobium sp. SL115]MCY1671681.1 hypothetical protein [Novosphingobium sp. SL115]